MRRHGKRQRGAAGSALEAVFLRTSYDTFAYFPEPKVATAAVHALGVIPGPESSAALRRLLARTHHAGDRKQITAALNSP